MIILFQAEVYRLKKNKCFWLLLVLFSIFGIYIYLNYNDLNPSKCVSCTNQLGSVLFKYSTLNYIFLPILTSIFIGQEYTDNVIKNKITIGHKRSDIYISYLLLMIIISLIYSLIYLIITLIIGNILVPSITMKTSELIYLFISTIFINISTSSLFTFIAMLIVKHYAPTYSFITVIWSLFITSNILPKLVTSSGNLKILYTIIMNIIPLGQALCIDNNLYSKFMPLYSLIFIIIINFYGIILINKKEII